MEETAPTVLPASTREMSDLPNLRREKSASTLGTDREDGSIRHHPFGPKLSMPRTNGRRHDRTAGLQWRGEYTAASVKRGRVLMIDYIQKDPGSLTRKVWSDEIDSIEKLEKIYKTRAERDEEVALRVFHVQNWSEAQRFFANKFRLHDEDDVLSAQTGFYDWIMEKRPRRRAGKPLLGARTWKVTTDPWRQVAKCAVGLDLMKIYPCSTDPHPTDNPSKVTGLMGYDSEELPVHHKDVASQRLSLYVQYALPEAFSPGPDVISPYHPPSNASRFDNGNTIIIFDNSETRSIKDTLIPARSEWEARWRRLPFHLATMPEISHDHEEDITGDCMRIITQDVFKAIAEGWDEVLDAAWEHVSILEAKIYEQPADESRAPELWENQAKWLVFEKLMYYHQDAVADIRKNLVDLDGDSRDAGEWLSESPDDFARIEKLIEDDLLKRTSNLSELMYKSVGIRDSRESLRLGASMWRLSWITFIFLPLNCLIAFFGMNVNILADNPSIEWFFISALPFFFFVLFLWFALKHFFAASRNAPIQRGVFEHLFQELQGKRPEIWTRNGPREYVQPKTRMGQWKWWLVLKWTTGDALPQEPSPDDEPIGAWNRVKRCLIRRWTKELTLVGEGEDDLEVKFNNGKDRAVVAGLKESISPAVIATPRMLPSINTESDTGIKEVLEEVGNVLQKEEIDAGMEPVVQCRTVDRCTGLCARGESKE